VRQLNGGGKGPSSAFQAIRARGRRASGRSIARALAGLSSVSPSARPRRGRDTRPPKTSWGPSREGHPIHEEAGTVNPSSSWTKRQDGPTSRRSRLPPSWRSWTPAERNYSDHYLEVPYDLFPGHVITTGQFPSRHPFPLLDAWRSSRYPAFRSSRSGRLPSPSSSPGNCENGLSRARWTPQSLAILDVIRYWTMESGSGTWSGDRARRAPPGHAGVEAGCPPRGAHGGLRLLVSREPGDFLAKHMGRRRNVAAPTWLRPGPAWTESAARPSRRSASWREGRTSS
jgi:hypothetical protein